MISSEYAAGFMDGEGMVTVYRRMKGHYGDKTDNYQLRIVISNTDLRPLLAFKERWGGHIKKLKKYAPHHRTRYNWTIAAKLGIVMLRDILPFLIIKREAAIAGLEVQETNIANQYRRFKPITPELEARRLELWSKVKELNHRGIREVHRGIREVHRQMENMSL